jgi:hypothetical protein
MKLIVLFLLIIFNFAVNRDTDRLIIAPLTVFVGFGRVCIWFFNTAVRFLISRLLLTFLFENATEKCHPLRGLIVLLLDL